MRSSKLVRIYIVIPASPESDSSDVLGHFADHPVEDIIEKIACQFTARHIRGRPRPPYWYLGFPLYVCDSRYNDRERVFVRIKNWNSCVPEEVRQNTEFMPIYPFERIVYPVRIPSPFLAKSKGGMKWPGGIVGHSDVPEGPFESDLRKRAAMNASTAALTPRVAAPSIPVHSTPNPPLNQLQLAPRRTPGPDKSIISAAGAPSSAHVEKIAPETGEKMFSSDKLFVTQRFVVC
jgi:chromatin structure-remodeling complex subunit RSC1/2